MNWTLLVLLKQKVIILELGSCAIRAGILGETGESLLNDEGCDEFN